MRHDVFVLDALLAIVDSNLTELEDLNSKTNRLRPPNLRGKSPKMKAKRDRGCV